MTSLVFVIPGLLLPAAAIHVAPVALESTQPTIPGQLVLTSSHGSLDDLPPKVRDNVRHTLAINPKLQMRWLDDGACRGFIRDNFGAGLLSAFDSEHRGNVRGDICRAAVVALEGGFYVDLDVQMRVPFSQLVDNTTTFMTVINKHGDVLNALFAAERGSEVMKSVLAAIEGWYGGLRPPRRHSGSMGSETMMLGLETVASRDCPSVDVNDGHQLQRACGPHHRIRLYRERSLECGPHSAECPPPRQGGFTGVRYGIFEPGPQRNLVAWPRFDSCESSGCGHINSYELQRMRDSVA